MVAPAHSRKRVPLDRLVFALGFYVVAMITNNTGLTRICLAVFTLLGAVAIPTYFSGTGSWDVLSGNSKISEDLMLMDYHYGWGVTALAVLMVTGAVACIELLRSSRFGKFSNNALHLVLGLAIVSLGLMAVAGEMGWELNHHELPLATEKTPQIWSHVHIILNHFPSVGFVFALGFYLVGVIADNAVMKRSSLAVFVICPILIVPTYVTGNASAIHR